MAWLTRTREAPTSAARSLCVRGRGMRVPFLEEGSPYSRARANSWAATRPGTSSVATDRKCVLASRSLLERTFARLSAIVGSSSTLVRKIPRSISRKRVSSNVITLAERPKLSARLISPINSSRPKAARTTSVPSGRVTYTFTLPSRTTYTVSLGSSTVMTWAPAGKVLRRRYASILDSCSAGRPRNSATSERILDSGVSATLSAPLPAEVVRSGMVAFSQGILYGLLQRHRLPLSERRFPRHFVEPGACRGHAAVVVWPICGGKWGTHSPAQGLRSPPQPRRARPLPPRPGQPGEALQAVSFVLPAPYLPIQRQALLEKPLCCVVVVAVENRYHSQPPRNAGHLPFVRHLAQQS